LLFRFLDAWSVSGAEASAIKYLQVEIEVEVEKLEEQSSEEHRHETGPHQPQVCGVPRHRPYPFHKTKDL
jgi:hypothetical protein